MSQEDESLNAGIQMSETIYSEYNNTLGSVRGINGDGFYVLAPENASEKGY